MNKSDYERLSHFRYRLRCFLRISEDLCQTHGLTPLQYQFLLHVSGIPGKNWATVGEIAERLQAKHHGVVALIDRCEKSGLVERRPSLEDRRQVEIHLLSKGARLLARLAVLHQPELRQLREEFNSAGWDPTAETEQPD
ncbi:MAG: MarR family transcriptional regulator [Proteobacteria bacterium]|nr:MarR family transcriptional regulator [Pseudomonadota bacterium]